MIVCVYVHVCCVCVCMCVCELGGRRNYSLGTNMTMETCIQSFASWLKNAECNRFMVSRQLYL